ncbi:MAG: hypothetical protein QXS37_02355, partial [Candidatus Aenigmatarchaeota archaeon]
MPNWFLTCFLFLRGKIGNVKITRNIKEKTLFYSFLVTFIILHFAFLLPNVPIILAQTTTTTTPSCKYSCDPCTAASECCSYYSSGNYCYYSPSCGNYPCDGTIKACMHQACEIDVCREGSSTLTIGRSCSASGCSGGTTYTCDSSHCGEARSCGGTTYYCVYDSGWKWRTSIPSGFCCSNSDCSGSKICSNYRCVCPSGGCEDYQGYCVSSESFGHQDTPQLGERCPWEYCLNGVWYNCNCMCTSDLCPPFGVYYGAQQGTEACVNGACCAGGAPTCICITCDSDSDCPACSNGAVPRCVYGRCICEN